MTHTPTLKPCPFCGGEAKTQSAWITGGETGVKCITCNFLIKANKPFETSQEELFYAITAWNTRTEAIEAGAVQGLVDAAKDAQYIVSRYRAFLETITSAEVELHPYIPSVEDADEKLIAALSQLAEASNGK